MYDIIPLHLQSYTECIRDFYSNNFRRQDAKIPRLYPVVLTLGPNIPLNLKQTTTGTPPNDDGRRNAQNPIYA